MSKKIYLLLAMLFLVINLMAFVYAADSDGDGINDNVDNCQNTPSSCTGGVDATGCPIEPVEIAIRDGVSSSCPGSSIPVRLINNCLKDNDINLVSVELTMKDNQENIVYSRDCTFSGDREWCYGGEDRDGDGIEDCYCEFKTNVPVGYYNLMYKYNVVGNDYEDIFKNNFEVSSACSTGKCGHVWQATGQVTYKLEFNSSREIPHNIMEGNTIIIYPDTKVSVKDINSFFIQSSDGDKVGAFTAGFLAWVYDEKVDNTKTANNGVPHLNNLAISHNSFQGGFFYPIPPTTRNEVFQSTQGFKWTSDLGFQEGSKFNYTNDFFEFKQKRNFTIQTDYITAFCDSPDFICPVNKDDVCKITDYITRSDGFEPLNYHFISVVAPDVTIQQRYTPGYDTLIRLYENGRNITFPFNVTNVGSHRTKVKVALDCSNINLECQAIDPDEQKLEPENTARFKFSIKLSNLSNEPFNYKEAPLILNHTIHPKIIVNTSYCNDEVEEAEACLPTYKTIVKEANITLVDQDWSDNFCRSPNSADTGILEGIAGNLDEFNWLVSKENGYFSLSYNSFKTCCGDDSINDTWDNPLYHGYNASCYNGNRMFSCDLTQDNEVVNENGTLFLCGVASADLTGQITQSADYCRFKCENTLFCSYNNKWGITNGKNRNESKSWVDGSIEQSTECCEPDKCWNGAVCVENAVNNPSGEVYNGYRCINGAWLEAETRCVPEQEDTCTSYCPSPTQCLVDLQGNAEDNNNPEGNPQCISDGQYITDDYCEDGIWTSRTKFIALQLLNIPQSQDNYDIFCGNYGEVLNFLEYEVAENKNARDYVADNTNNYCVLIYNNNIIFGTSLNQEINERDYKFMDVVNADCSNAMNYNDGNYHQCSTDKAWYNKKLKSIIYSQTSIQLPAIDLESKFIEFLGNPFSFLINKLNEFITPPYDYSFVKGVKTFKKIYGNKKNDKFILGAIEGVHNKNIMLEYKNFNTDVCKEVSAYNEYHHDEFSGAACSKEPNTNNYYVLVQGHTLTIDPANIWADLTSKLRVT